MPPRNVIQRTYIEYELYNKNEHGLVGFSCGLSGLRGCCFFVVRFYDLVDYVIPSHNL